MSLSKMRFADHGENANYYAPFLDDVLKKCGEPGCENFQHLLSEADFCAVHELENWREELKRRWLMNPPRWTAEAEAQVRQWEAIVEVANV